MTLKIIGKPIQYFLQIMVRECMNEMEKGGHENLTEEIISRAYHEGVLASYNQTYFEHYYERLKDYYGENIPDIAKKILTELSRNERVERNRLWKIFLLLTEGRGDEDTFSLLLTELENDFYITCDQRKYYHFTTKVLKDWWERYHSI